MNFIIGAITIASIFGIGYLFNTYWNEIAWFTDVATGIFLITGIVILIGHGVKVCWGALKSAYRALKNRQ